MKEEAFNFIQSNSPDGGFLQSEYWRRFQESVGRKTFEIEIKEDDEYIAFANIIEHKLPIVGSYFYAPRGPVIGKSQIPNPNIQINPKSQIPIFLENLVSLARKEHIGWVRIELVNEEIVELIKENLPKGIQMKKSPLDMQPREILMMDISGSEEDMLAWMKPKTRYNIRLAEKKNVKVFTSREEKYIDGFCRLVEITAKRDKIKSHPENYYRKMIETIPDDILKLYIAEFEGNIIAANFVLFFGHTATYIHGTSDNEYRNVMAPYLLQWQAILDAKKAGCEKYDFGGVKTGNAGGKSWEGITKFKTGFAPDVEPIKFPGCYDIIFNPGKYRLYKILQKIKRLL